MQAGGAGESSEVVVGPSRARSLAYCTPPSASSKKRGPPNGGPSPIIRYRAASIGVTVTFIETPGGALKPRKSDADSLALAAGPTGSESFVAGIVVPVTEGPPVNVFTSSLNTMHT